MKKKIISSVLAMVIILQFNCFLFAASSSELNELNQKIDDAQDQKKDAETERKEVSAQKSKELKEIEKLSNSIEDNKDKLEEIDLQLTQLNKEIKQLESELKEAEKKYQQQEDALKQKLIVGYEMGETTYLDVLLNSKGILDFLSNYYFISEILQNDNDLLDTIEEQKDKIEKNKKEQEAKKKEVKTQKAEQEKINVLLSNQKTQKQNKVSELSNEEKDLQKKIDEYDRLIDEAQKEVQKIAAGSTGQFVGGNKVWPCKGYTRITSGYGERNTGIPGASTNHKGIDIGCPTGTPILSVLDGKVIFRGYNTYRGYYIMVDHGGGVVTLYQHCTNSFKVSVGDKVKAGQTIVLSGSSGVGSGPHLHFEVLINKVNVNPQNWLKQS